MASRNFVKFINGKPLGSVTVFEGKSKDIPNFPYVTVIIPTLDAYRGGYFPKLLEQIKQQTFQNFEVIVVKGDPRQGRAINTGVSLARGEIIITLDDDTRLGDEKVFENLVKAMDAHPEIGMAGVSNLVPEDAPWLVRRVMKEVPRRSSKLVNKITESDLAEHPCCAIRKSVFMEVGGENELIPRGLDPYLRSEIRKAGYKVVVIPNTWIHHLPPNSLKKLIKQFFRNGKDAAYCNKFYPQWVIETPDGHVGTFREKVPIWFRWLRYAFRMLKAFFSFKWIYLLTMICYAAGFAWGYLTLKGRPDG